MKKISIYSFFSTITVSFLFSVSVLCAASAVKRLTWNTSLSIDPFIVVDSNDNLHVVWQNEFGSSFPSVQEICYKNSTNGGVSWSPIKRMTYSSGTSRLPALAVDSSDNLHLVWISNSQFYYKKSTNSGNTWSSAKRLIWNTQNASSVYIACADFGRIHVVLQQGYKGFAEIYHKKSTDGGITWIAAKRLTWTGGKSKMPRIAVDSANAIHVVWEGDLSGNDEIYYKKSTNAGAVWSAAKRLTYNSGDSWSPKIGITDNDSLHVVWRDTTPGNPEIYYKKSTNSGTGWQPLKRLTWNAGWSDYPEVVGKFSAVHLLWRDNTPGIFQWFFKRGDNNGSNWGSTNQITWRSDFVATGNLAVDSNGLNHIVWYDYTAGNAEIYYKQY